MRKFISVVGSAAVMVAALAVPASATVQSCEAGGGNGITIGVAALPAHIPGYNWDTIVANNGDPQKATICHFGQNHDTDFWIGWA